MSKNQNEVPPVSAEAEIITPEQRVGKLEHEVAFLTINNPLSYLTEAQRAALKGKFYLQSEAEQKECYALTPGNSDEITAYVAASIVDEANARIFSTLKAGIVGKCLGHYTGLASNVDVLVKASEYSISKECEEITGKQKRQILQTVKAQLLKGKTSMDAKTLTAFILLCNLLGHEVDTIQ